MVPLNGCFWFQLIFIHMIIIAQKQWINVWKEKWGQSFSAGFPCPLLPPIGHQIPNQIALWAEIRRLSGMISVFSILVYSIRQYNSYNTYTPVILIIMFTFQPRNRTKRGVFFLLPTPLRVNTCLIGITREKPGNKSRCKAWKTIFVSDRWLVVLRAGSHPAGGTCSSTAGEEKVHFNSIYSLHLHVSWPVFLPIFLSLYIYNVHI